MRARSRALAALLGGLGVASIVAALLVARERPPDRVLVSDVGGPIRLAAATASSARRSSLRNAAFVTELGRMLPHDVELLLLTNDVDAFELHPGGRRTRFVELPSDVSLTMWPQDPFVVMRERTGESFLLASRAFERADDARMAEALGEALGWRVERAPYAFEGGNLVSDDAFVFVGADTLVRNALELDVDLEAVAIGFERLFGKPVVAVGPNPQPIAHIDLVVTLLGRGRVLVADPGRGARLAEEALRDRADSVTAFETRAQEAFFGNPSIDRVTLAGGDALERPSLEGATRGAIEASRSIAPHYDTLAESLRSKGLSVERIPLLVGAHSIAPREDVDAAELEARRPDYPLLSYNNVVMEEHAGRGRVYLPRYGFEALDEAGRDVWKGLGFEVVPIDGLTTSAMYGGALRCALKVLGRDAPGG